VVQSAVAGLLSGGAYAALGVCVVVMYRVVGVLNFAQAGIGTFGAFVTFVVHGHGVPYGPALLVGAVAGAGVATIAGVIMAVWFAQASPQVRSTVSIALLVAILAAGFRVFGDSPRTVPGLFPGMTIRLGGVVVTMAGLAAIFGALAIALFVSVFLRRTRTGVLMRALSERPQTAELLGAPVRRIAVGVWAAGGAISSIAVLMIASSRSGDFLNLSLLIMPALATALIGVAWGLAATAVGGIAIGLLEGLATNFTWISEYRQTLPFFVIVVVLLWSERHEVWDAAR
jgi:branched-chain amino acid transport system permease protein